MPHVDTLPTTCENLITHLHFCDNLPVGVNLFTQKYFHSAVFWLGHVVFSFNGIIGFALSKNLDDFRLELPATKSAFTDSAQSCRIIAAEN